MRVKTLVYFTCSICLFLTSELFCSYTRGHCTPTADATQETAESRNTHLDGLFEDVGDLHLCQRATTLRQPLNEVSDGAAVTQLRREM